jgi:magnesium-dependent phosphatase 1
MRRDGIIANSFGVRKPYILFSRHHWMDLLAVTWRKNHTGRFSEMVLYPQVQDALFYGEPWKLSNAQPWIDGGSLPGFDFRHNLANWGIKWNSETAQDFRNHNEDFR